MVLEGQRDLYAIGGRYLRVPAIDGTQVATRRSRGRVADPAHQILDRRASRRREGLASVPQVILQTNDEAAALRWAEAGDVAEPAEGAYAARVLDAWTTIICQPSASMTACTCCSRTSLACRSRTSSRQLQR